MEKSKLLRIGDVLKEKNITNREFAKRLGKSPQYTNAIIKERSGASLTMLATMADTLGVNIKELFI